MTQIIQEKQLHFGFSDSSRNDEQDTIMPYPVAMSSAKAEYIGCVCFMAASHLRMVLCKLLLVIDSS
jgi:hypothetical protein